MSKYFDEQDFNSDCETIERNKLDLLEHLAQSVTRFVKTDPTKFVENLKNPAPEIAAQDLKEAVLQVKAGKAGDSSLDSSALTQTGNEGPEPRENKNKLSKKQVQLVIEPSSLAAGVSAETQFDAVMQSPHVAGQPRESPACVDEESIAFGVMYFPRTRPQLQDEFNCDTRDARFLCEVIEEGQNCENFIVVPNEDLYLGFVSDSELEGSTP